MAEVANGAHVQSVQKTLEQINSVNQSVFVNDETRTEALLAVYALVARLEKPWETVARWGMAQPALAACLKTAKDLQLFEKWHAKGDEPQSVQQLAELVSCDPILLQRLLRHCAANHVLTEVSQGVFQQTPLTLSLIDPVFGAWIDYTYDAMLPCYSKLPEYLKNTKYANPENPDDGIFQYALGWNKNLFSYYDAHPEQSKTFNYMMGGVMSRQASWLDIYPHDQLLRVAGSRDPLSESSPILIDIGGNRGYDIDRFRVAHPDLAGRLILQDRPEVVQDALTPEPVQRMGYDFFTPQPVKGARAYYMHGVLHDWSDKPALEILRQQRPAMELGYSKLLVHDYVMQDEKAHPMATAYDLTMMVKVAALERTEAMWQNLLGAAGFKIVKIWTSPLATQSLIEAEPV